MNSLSIVLITPSHCHHSFLIPPSPLPSPVLGSLLLVPTRLLPSVPTSFVCEPAHYLAASRCAMVRTSRKPTPKRQRPAGSVRSFFISIGTFTRLRRMPAVVDRFAAARSAARGATKPALGSQVTLYPCQKAGITACLKALRRGFTRLGVSSPTGSGKTTTFINLLPRIPLREVGNQVLILVPTVTIANQVAIQIRIIHGRSYVVEKEYDGHHDTQTPGAPPDV